MRKVKAKDIIWGAKVLSMIFTPFYLSVLGVVLLLFCSYLNILPFIYKLFLTLTTLVFTVIIPTTLIAYYRKHHGWTHIQLSARPRRMIPYLISSANYLACIYIMGALHAPHLVATSLLAALFIQLMCAFINIWWKISTHMAATGGITGGLMAISIEFAYNPIWWVCLLFFISGLVGTSRIILKQHTVSQVSGGFMTGMMISFVTILFF